MRIDFSVVLKNLVGDPLKEDGKDFTLAMASCTALMQPAMDEPNIPADAKVRRFKLATVIVHGGEQDLTIEEVAELKRLIGKIFGPLVVGRAFEILDPAEVKKTA